ncbi:MAG: tetratricopeptide repeat protein [Thermodesulfobacteriota bacterium]
MAFAHGLLSNFYCYTREYDKAIAEGERAVALNPSGAQPNNFYALTLILDGRPEEAIPFCQKAVRLNPIGPAPFFLNYGHALCLTGRFDEAILAYRKALQRSPHHIMAHVYLSATYSLMGREKEAQAEAEEVLRINPKYSLEYFIKINPYKDHSSLEKYFIKPLRKAGLK